MSPAIVSNVGGIHTIEKPLYIGRKPKFLCRICKGGHLNHLFPTTVVVEEAQSLYDKPVGSVSSLVSQNSTSSLDTTIMPIKSSPDTTAILRSEASFDHVIYIYSPVPSEQERVFLSLSMLPPSLREVHID